MVLIGLFGKKPKTEFEPNLGEKKCPFNLGHSRAGLRPILSKFWLS